MSTLSQLTSLAENPVVETGVTVFAFLAATRIARLGGNHPLLNPTLIAIVLIALGLEATRIPYETYLHGAHVIHFMLGPAVVLLAVPLFRQRAVIRASARLIAVGLAVGLPVGVLSAVGIAWGLGATTQTILSLAPKSVTAGIAVGISEQIGGLQTLTIVLVIMTGITGAVLGPIIARLARIEDPRVVVWRWALRHTESEPLAHCRSTRPPARFPDLPWASTVCLRLSCCPCSAAFSDLPDKRALAPAAKCKRTSLRLAWSIPMWQAGTGQRRPNET
jgi:putative effector of murein hydrolase